MPLLPPAKPPEPELPTLAGTFGEYLRMDAYKPLSGPCIVFEGKDWLMRSGTYKSDEDAAADAAKTQAKRKDKVTVRAGRWEEMYETNERINNA